MYQLDKCNSSNFGLIDKATTFFKDRTGTYRTSATENPYFTYDERSREGAE